MFDYSLYETRAAEPEAFSMLETLRAVGYTTASAVADIIDNSISANAKNIWVDFEWKGVATWLSVRDDGSGMNDPELIQAMRPGSKNPLESRRPEDLGRFGMGLKTASFSQCRNLSVISKKQGEEAVYWSWDLDFVQQKRQWLLIKRLPDETFLSRLNTASGTIVIWNDIDRIVGNMRLGEEKDFEKFLGLIHEVKRTTAMLFHRFIERGKVKLFFNGKAVEPWNPFLPEEPATQGFPEEAIHDGKVRVKGYVLPHRSKLSEEKFAVAEGLLGWTQQQGFYVYRNERLLLAGDWLGQFRKEEHFKLARIQIDLPNTLDKEWQIDIKKSRTRLPFSVRDQLKAYAATVRAQAVEVYRHRGKTLRRSLNEIYQPVWQEKVFHGKRFYEINREHPSIKVFLQESPEKVKQVFRLLEETVPIPLIALKENENPDSFKRPFEEPDRDLNELAKTIYKSLRRVHDESQAKAILLMTEPFSENPELIESL
jgi:hypothetical protein